MEADIRGNGGRDLVQQLRGGDHQSGKDPVGARISRLFLEIDDHAGMIGDGDAAAGRVRYPVEAERGDASRTGVKGAHAPQVGIGEDVGIQNPEGGIGIDPGAVGGKGSGRSQQLRFMHDQDIDRGIGPFEVALDLLRMSVKIEENVGDTGAGAELEPDIEQGLAANRHQALGQSIGERPQTGAMTSGQKEGFQRETRSRWRSEGIGGNQGPSLGSG